MENKKPLLWGIIFAIIISVSTLILVDEKNNSRKMTFWETQPQRGANCMNKILDREWFQAAANVNIKWVRLTYDKWATKHRDFLIGNASDYQGLVPDDLSRLKEVLSWANEQGLKIVLAPLSLPGCRWHQNNDGRYDARLWESYHYQEMAIRFWKDLARELKDYDGIVAYDILNEPCPEKDTELKEQTEIGDVERFATWYSRYKNTPRDLYDFHTRMIREIRKIDRVTPIMVESGFYGSADSYCGWPDKLEDPYVLYSVHMYTPYTFTSNDNSRRGSPYAYPGNIEFGDKTIWWDRDTLIRYGKPFERWMKNHGVPQERIVVSEFGCMRRNPGAIKYMEDLVSIWEERHYHWAFYAFREDWDGYDYELGTESLPETYWQILEQNGDAILPRKDNPLFDVIKNRLQQH
ncbi:MAG: glycoside hydrolase family 5 protein [Puniceicoccales bacterium]|jgi:hypothetical protein|nr:glycoside hydrolase family 5 protein [Puniceicoccales bacterium]